MRGRTAALYVNLGTGVAAGIVTGGELQLGAHGAAGEIGYIAPTLESVANRRPDEALLEERIGGRGVATWASVELGHAVTMAALMAAPEHTPEAELRERLLREIGFWVANVTVVLDPEVVVLGGGIMRAASDLCHRLELAIASTGPFPVKVVPARFGPESSLLGAGAIALDAAGLPRPT
jgi:glucokinase